MCCQSGKRSRLQKPIDVVATRRCSIRMQLRWNHTRSVQSLDPSPYARGWKARKYLLLPVEGEKCPLTCPLIDQAVTLVTVWLGAKSVGFVANHRGGRLKCVLRTRQNPHYQFQFPNVLHQPCPQLPLPAGFPGFWPCVSASRALPAALLQISPEIFRNRPFFG